MVQRKEIDEPLVFSPHDVQFAEHLRKSREAYLVGNLRIACMGVQCGGIVERKEQSDGGLPLFHQLLLTW